MSTPKMPLRPPKPYYPLTQSPIPQPYPYPFWVNTTMSLAVAPDFKFTSYKGGKVVFDFEKIEAYRVSLKLIDIAMRIISRFPRGHANLADQLRRSTSGVSLTISEGVGEYRPKEKARFYRMSLRSVSESCSAIQIAHRLRIVSDIDYADAYETCTVLSKMLTSLVRSMNDRDQRDKDRDGA